MSGAPSASEPHTVTRRPSEAPHLTSLVAGALGGAALSSVGVARLSAHAAAQESSAGELFASAVGLLWPLSLLVGALVGLGFWLLHPQGPRAGWTALPRTAVARWAAMLSGLASLLVLYLLSRAALALLGAGLGAATGVALAAAACGLFLAGASLAWLIASFLVRRFPAPSLEGALIVSGICFLAGFGLLLWVGEPSGGPRPFQVFGVLRRPELDLGPALHLSLLALGAYLGALFLHRRLLGGLLALLPVIGFGAAWNMTEDVGFAWERSRGLAARVLPLARRLTDGDGDGFARAFGGGDCDDRNPEIHPGALDVPGNGVDEDCSGSDAVLPSSEPAPPVEPPKEATRELLPERPNVVLITIDTLRWDLGYMGNPRPLSRRLDELAAKSTVFEHAYALASYTSKSLGPMLIGKYPSETHRDWSHFDRFSTDEKFVQERLQAAGIRTISVQGYWYFMRPGYGYERGFDVLDVSATPKLILIEGDRRVTSEGVSDAVIQQLEDPKLTEQQFYLWAHYVDPHAEYVPHADFDFGKDERARYDGEVAFVDRHVGRVLDALNQSPFSDRTIVIITSDHGEAFGEHGLIRHGFEVWEELSRVPLILYVPGAEPRRVKAPRSILDVVPTILDAFGLPQPRVEDAAEQDPNFVRGESLLHDVRTPRDQEPKVRPVLVDMPEAPNNKERLAFYDWPHKIIISQGRVLGVYDLAEDPGEKRNLKDDRELVERLLSGHQALQSKLRKFKPRR